jgi:pimeloyl-ACP methyl ester carboxylesterase
MFNKVDASDASRARLRVDYDWFDQNKDEDIYLTSSDGLKLAATVVRVKDKDSKGVIILFHGYRSAFRRDLCLQMRILHEAGYDIIAAHQRSHGKSEGKYICYGIKEREDAMLWRAKAAELFGKDTPVALMGLSMGGATVLMASDLADQKDTALRCIVADCPFSYPWDIVREVMLNRYKLYHVPMLYFINFWCRAIAKYSLCSNSSKKSVCASHLPILIFHGDSDTFVAHSHSRSVADASPRNTRLVTIPGADHAQAIFYDEELYTKELLSFLEKHM